MNASNKFDREQSYSTHGYPAKTSSTRRRLGNGHWLVAYRKAIEINYKNVYKRVKEVYKKQTDCGNAGGRTLNKALLLQLHCTDEPFELSTVDIVEQHLHDVNYEDCTLFNNVIHIDASINFLSLDHFRGFGSLKELNLSLNRLQDVTFDPVDFPRLEVLDLSFNNLSGDAIAAVGRLSRLRVLHLTGNQLYHLPLNLNPNTIQPTSEVDPSFKCLEVLMLDDNKLSSDVFSCLANLKRLKYLNLRGNAISEVPLLELLDHLKTLQTSTEHHKSDRETHENIKDNLLKLMQFIQQKDWEEYKEASFPFPELHFLNLSGNKIAEEEALLAVALFPVFSEIDISSNPLTTQRSGDPPLLTYYLHDKLGVKIKRKNEQEVKALAKVSVLPRWKPHNVIPDVSKKTQRLNHRTHVGAKKEKVKQVSSDYINEHTPVQPFFVTETEKNVEPEMKTFKETSLDGTVDFTSHKSVTDLPLVEPIGIQTAVQMLEHTLKNLNVYRDSKPKLDSIQTPYRETEKRIKALPPPPAPPLQQQSEQIDRMIEEIKLNRTMREVPLTKVIKGAQGNKHDYKEAVSLLNDMKAKYKIVHRKTMEQAASLGSENTEQPMN